MNENFDAANDGEIPQGWIKTGDWGVAYGGEGFGKVLYGDYFNVPYAGDKTGMITSPAINLSDATSAEVTFVTRCDTQYAPDTDTMSLLASNNDGNFQNITTWNEATIDSDGNSDGGAVRQMSAQIPSSLFGTNSKIAFKWVTNSIDNDYDGCFVDDVVVTKNGGTSGDTTGGGSGNGGGTSGDTGGDTGTAGTTTLVTTVTSVAGDTDAPYQSTVENPQVVIHGAEGMSCRWDVGDTTYANMPANNEIPVTGTFGSFTYDAAGSSGGTVYVSCKDADNNEQTVAQNLDINFTVSTPPADTSTGGDTTGTTGGGTTSTTTTSTSGTDPISACGELNDAGKTYVLSYDLSANNSCFTVGADNITIDGAGHTITGDGKVGHFGVVAENHNGLTIKNTTFKDFDYGVHLTGVNNSTIENDTFTTNSYGLVLHGGSHTTIRNNTATDNSVNGFYIESTDGTITGNTSHNNNVGIGLVTSEHNTVSSNNVYSNDRGILLLGSNNNTLTGNTSNGNSYGIALEVGSNGNTLTGNTADNNNVAVSLGSSGNIIDGLTINNSASRAIRFFDQSSTDNTIKNATVSGTQNGGLDLSFDAASSNAGVAGVNGTLLYNTPLLRYSIATPGGKLTVGNQYGQVALTQNAAGSGDNFSNDIRIENNKITIAEGSVVGVPAEITLQGLGTSSSTPTVYKNGAACTECTSSGVITQGAYTFTAQGPGVYDVRDGAGTPIDTNPGTGSGGDGGDNGTATSTEEHVTATLSNTPTATTTATSTNITVGGTGVTHYMFWLHDFFNNTYSTERPVSEPLVFPDLQPQHYVLDVIGRNAAGTWQSTTTPTRFEWTVSTTTPSTDDNGTATTTDQTATTTTPVEEESSGGISGSRGSRGPVIVETSTSDSNLTNPSVVLFPETIVVSEGETVKVPVLVYPIDESISHAHIEIHYPTDLLQATDFTYSTEGGFTTDTSEGNDSIDTTSGTIVKSVDWDTAITAPTLIGTITFTAQHPGIGKIEVTDATELRADRNRNVFDASEAPNAVVTVTTAGQTNSNVVSTTNFPNSNTTGRVAGASTVYGAGSGADTDTSPTTGSTTDSMGTNNGDVVFDGTDQSALAATSTSAFSGWKGIGIGVIILIILAALVYGMSRRT